MFYDCEKEMVSRVSVTHRFKFHSVKFPTQFNLSAVFSAGFERSFIYDRGQNSSLSRQLHLHFMLYPNVT